jgi:hypothetical protein
VHLKPTMRYRFTQKRLRFHSGPPARRHEKRPPRRCRRGGRGRSETGQRNSAATSSAI